MRTPQLTFRFAMRALVAAACAVLVILSALAAPLAQETPRDPIRRARLPVKGQYLVKLHADIDADAVAVESAARYRGRLRHTYRRAVQGFAVQMSEAAARSLARDPRVAVVEEDGVVTPSAVQVDPPSWGLDRIDQRTLPLDARYTYPPAAAAVNVYVIDSGLRVSHVEFEGRAFIGGDFVDDDNDGDPEDVANDDGEPALPDGADCLGHGTHMAGTIGGRTAGVAKSALLWGVRVFGCDGSGTWAGVIAAVEMITAEARRPAVVNMSLSGGPSIVADDAIRESIASGITYVIAAGNAGDDAGNYSPSRLAQALVVGSTAIDDGRSLFSNWGATVDVFAPGEAIVSAAIETDVDLAIASGTSAAAAHAAGVAAIYLGARPGDDPRAVHAAIAAGATSGIVRDAGPGPNRLLYAGILATPVLTVTSPNHAVNWGRGSHQTISWTHNGEPGDLVRVLLSRDGGRSYVRIADGRRSTAGGSGSLRWQVTGPDTSAAMVRVEFADGAAADESDTTFVIAAAYIRLKSPNGGEVLHARTPIHVRWDDNLGPTDQVSVALSKNDGVTYRWVLVPRTNADGVEPLLLNPAHSTGRGRLRVIWLDNPRVADASDSTFRIGP